MTGDWGERVREQVAASAAQAMRRLQPCTDITIGRARVDRVASNRRVMGEDGKVRAVRWTKTLDPDVRAAPEGVIDPELKTIGFWNDEEKIASLHYYAVHPTSYDRTGEVTHDFVGLARERLRREDADTHHLYFTGCAGNITAGKYNDGSVKNRTLFTNRIYEAMKLSEKEALRRPLVSLEWHVEPICLPPRGDLEEEKLRACLLDPGVEDKAKSKAALMLTYLLRREVPMIVGCLHLNDNVAILHLPGEAFIEYQMYAQEFRRDAFIAVASYGDLGPGYITLKRSFDEGGYEPKDAFVSGESERIMLSAIRQVLRHEESLKKRKP